MSFLIDNHYNFVLIQNSQLNLLVLIQQGLTENNHMQNFFVLLVYQSFQDLLTDWHNKNNSILNLYMHVNKMGFHHQLKLQKTADGLLHNFLP